MEYADYKEILDRAMVDYVNQGGSVFHIDGIIREYTFTYSDENLSADAKERLDNKAVQAIVNKQKLPSGVKLEQCIWYRRDE